MSDTVLLDLECFPDELSPIQLETYEKAEKEHNEIRAKLNVIMRGSSSENLFSGNIFSAYQLTGLVTGLESYAKAPSVIRSQNKKIVKNLKGPAPAPIEYDDHIEIDDDDGDVEYQPPGKRVSIPTSRASAPSRAAVTTPSIISRKSKVVVEPPRKIAKTVPSTTTVGQKPSEANTFGGLLIGSAVPEPKDKSGVDCQEVSFSKLQGKTYPSLVVFVRPTLTPRESQPIDRQTLDFKVKTVLMYTPTKFTEWLIQQGLVRSEQDCNVHSGTPLKLGMYSDTNRFLYSGGYVWISECCPTRFTSVYCGSIFESSTQTPSVLLKLIYHWSCQTNVQNVVQWVKVSSLFIKQYYTLLRSVCTVALYNHFGLMGGPGKRIEVGVISLGTSSSNGAQRQVKVEVLGIFDPATKQLRLRAIDPLPVAEKVYRKRFLKILEPLVDWVHEDSIILTDMTVDKGTLNNYGFRNVIQANPADVSNNPKAQANSNVRIMDYLRRVVPRMFQNTLSLLNRAMIQQFLDELMWREVFGLTPNTAYENILKHISEQTRVTQRDRLFLRLFRVASNPFKNWKITGNVPVPRAVESASNSRKTAATPVQKRKHSPPPRPIPVTTSRKSAPPPPLAKRSAPPPTPPAAKRPYTKKTPEVPVETVSLEGYYYGVHVPTESEQKKDSCEEVVFEVKCPECELTFVTNLELQDHLYDHVNSIDVTTNKYQCRYCFERSRDHDHLWRHIMDNHPIEVNRKGAYYDLICEQKFVSSAKLSTHMGRLHYPSELPYHCGCCSYASSSRRLTVDHFYEEHGKSAALMCSLCLCVFVCANRQEGALAHNVNAFLDHLKEHRNHKAVRPCPRCKLCFVSLGAMRVHMFLDHTNEYAESGQLQPISKSNTNIMRPKNKLPPSGLGSFLKIVGSAKDLILDVPNGHMCLECGQDFDSTNHIVGKVQCVSCGSCTYCLPSALDHVQKCTVQFNKFKLDQEYHCVCEFSTNEGTALARHLVACERKSAYPSVEMAKENIKKQDLLDGLGLVRVEEGVALDESDQGVVVAAEETMSTSAEIMNVEEASAVMDPNVVGFMATEEYNPNLSLADLAPTPSVIVQHMPDANIADDYQDLQTPQVPDSHMINYDHADDAIVQQVHDGSEQVIQGDYVVSHQDGEHNFQNY